MKGKPLQLRSLNRGWTDEGKLYRKMETEFVTTKNAKNTEKDGVSDAEAPYRSL